MPPLFQKKPTGNNQTDDGNEDDDIPEPPASPQPIDYWLRSVLESSTQGVKPSALRDLMKQITAEDVDPKKYMEKLRKNTSEFVPIDRVGKGSGWRWKLNKHAPKLVDPTTPKKQKLAHFPSTTSSD
jgi:hypothetical protein